MCDASLWVIPRRVGFIGCRSGGGGTLRHAISTSGVSPVAAPVAAQIGADCLVRLSPAILNRGESAFWGTRQAGSPFRAPGEWNCHLNRMLSQHDVTLNTAGLLRRPDSRAGAWRCGYAHGGERDQLPHWSKRHDQLGIDEPLEVGCEGLGEGPVADQDPRLGVRVEGLWGRVGGGHQHPFVVVDDGLGMEDRSGGVSRVDGTWTVVDVSAMGSQASTYPPTVSYSFPGSLPGSDRALVNGWPPAWLHG